MSEVMARELIEIRGLLEKALIHLWQDGNLDMGEFFLKNSIKKLDELLQSEEY